MVSRSDHVLEELQGWGLSVSLVFVVPYSSGSDPNSLIGLSELCLAQYFIFSPPALLCTSGQC